MGDAYLLVSIIIVVALIFDYTNGFHDAANAIATTVETKALTPRKALAVAAIGNLVGAFISEGVAKTVGSGIVDIKPSTEGLYVVLAGVFGAIAWNMFTWWFGIPSSSSHALIGGLVGAALASREIVQWDGVLSKVAIPMILSPLIGFTLAFLLTASLQGIFRNAKRSEVSKYFRAAQICSSTAMAVGHGLQDAQKTMGVMTLALVVGGFHSGDSIPTWVKISAALAIAAGTYAGGWRIMKTLGSVSYTSTNSVASQQRPSPRPCSSLWRLVSKHRSPRLTPSHQRSWVQVLLVESELSHGQSSARSSPPG
jgi:PiT family inorganic phosphate transporter